MRWSDKATPAQKARFQLTKSTPSDYKYHLSICSDFLSFVFLFI